jgi:hypothetical protein
MSDDQHQGDATDPVEVANRHCRGLLNALTAIDTMNADAWVVTNRMRASVDVLIYDLNEVVSYFTARSKP